MNRISDAVEYFKEEVVSAASKTYEELRQLNLGEFFTDNNGNHPYQGLRNEAIPDDIGSQNYLMLLILLVNNLNLIY
ncbi:hypothetical protein GKC56_03620 [Neisseriaceae bacterium PsAf]|nr:hypothetical protein [Neisseriaceae bacterium PsAf]